MSKTVFMRGLQMFISDIRSCANKEQEQKRVDKELAKIRAKFGEDKPLTGYDRRKYVWKLLYIYMLGYDIEFGHKQACDLIPLPKYSDKQVGYMACSLLLHENDEFLRLSINAIHLDLTSRNEAFQCLALSFVGNVGGAEMAEALTQDVVKLLTSGASRPLIKKRAALCLLRMLRKIPLDAQLLNPDSFASTLHLLLEESNLGLLLSSVTLLWGICLRNGPAGYESCQSRLIKLLERLLSNKERDIPAEYLYYGIPSPWLQTKCLRTLQFFGPPQNINDHKLLTETLHTIINTGNSDSLKSANPNKANAIHAILFEAISLALHLDDNQEMLSNCVAILARFLTTKEPNVKYLTLDHLARLALVPEILAAIRTHQATIVASLKDPDVSIRKRAMDLLFTMCDASVADDVVTELLKYLTIADLSFREELVLKIAILAEKFAPSVQWYVDAAMQLLERAGDFVSEDIWHRVVQLVTNNEGMQEYAAKNVADVLARGASHESLVSTAAYILGEYGRLIRAEKPPAELFRLLYNVFPAASQASKGLLMTAFVKLYLLDPTNPVLQKEVLGLFERYKKLMDPELQQRAIEYLALASNPAVASQTYVLPMPKWVERESTLLRRLQKTEGAESEGLVANAAVAAPGASGDAQPLQLPTTLPALTAAPGSAGIASPVGTSSDLLGSDYSAIPHTANGNGLNAVPAPLGQSRPSDPIDLLSDIFSGISTSSSAAPSYPAAYPTAAPAQPPQLQAYGSATAMPGSAAYGSISLPPSAAPSSPSSFAPAFPSPPSAAPVPASLAAPTAAFPAAAPAAAFPAAGGFDDPFGDSSFGPPPPAALPAFEPAVVTGDLEVWFTSLLLKERGILYEDQYLQVGVQSRYDGGRGELVLYWGNKSTTALTAVLCSATSVAGLHVQVGAVPASLAPKQQVQLPLQLVATSPFAEVPQLLLGYSIGSTRVQQDLKLPVVSHKFLVPEPGIAKELFFELWKTYSSPPYKAQEMVERSTPLASEVVVAILRSVNLGVEHGYLDPNPHNEAGAAYWVGSTGERHVCECRVEGNPTTRQQFRVTVSSPVPALSAGLEALLASQIRNAP